MSRGPQIGGPRRYVQPGRPGTSIWWEKPDDTGYLSPDTERWTDRDPSKAKAKAKPRHYVGNFDTTGLRPVRTVSPDTVAPVAPDLPDPEPSGTTVVVFTEAELAEMLTKVMAELRAERADDAARAYNREAQAKRRADDAARAYNREAQAKWRAENPEAVKEKARHCIAVRRARREAAFAPLRSWFLDYIKGRDLVTAEEIVRAAPAELKKKRIGQWLRAAGWVYVKPHSHDAPREWCPNVGLLPDATVLGNEKPGSARELPGFKDYPLEAGNHEYSEATFS